MTKVDKIEIQNWLSLKKSMENCPQTDNQSVWDHGQSVQRHLFALIDFLNSDKLKLDDWVLPDWIIKYRKNFLELLPNDSILENYTLFHDCGKPFCLTIDFEGKRHFPDHAVISSQKWNEVSGGLGDNATVGDLILRDMDIHLLKPEKVNEFCSYKYAAVLLLSGLSEIHSNAKAFSADWTESVNFKIKWKKLNQRGKSICETLFRKENENVCND